MPKTAKPKYLSLEYSDASIRKEFFEAWFHTMAGEYALAKPKVRKEIIHGAVWMWSSLRKRLSSGIVPPKSAAILLSDAWVQFGRTGFFPDGSLAAEMTVSFEAADDVVARLLQLGVLTDKPAKKPKQPSGKSKPA